VEFVEFSGAAALIIDQIISDRVNIAEFFLRESRPVPDFFIRPISVVKCVLIERFFPNQRENIMFRAEGKLGNLLLGLRMESFSRDGQSRRVR
jgi:hypothetical protein